MVVLAGLALAVGSGALSGGRSKPPSLYDRTLEVAGQYRCPVCASESAAVSDAAEAIEIRSLIQGWLKKGDSQAQIRHFLVSDYGPSILEKPPASGINTLVWALPAVAAALGIVGLGFGFARWRRASSAGPVVADGQSATALGVTAAASAPGSIPAGPVGAGPVPAAVQERLFDVGEEQGPLATEPRGTEPAGAVPPGAVPPGTVPPGAVPPGAVPLAQKPRVRPLYRRIAPGAGVALILVAGALWLVDRSTSERLPGSTISGGVSGIDEELEQASSLAASDPAGALAIYDAVLASDPDQPVALSAEGWIYAEAGYVARGEGFLQKAERADPSYDPPHLYRGLVLLEDQRQPAAAAKELKWYLAHGPDPTTTKEARTALAEAEAKAKAKL